MSRYPWATAIFALVLFSRGPQVRAAAAENLYDSRIAAARALSTEGSHAGARAIYAEALTLAADDEQKRWTQLWILTEELAEDRFQQHAPRIRAELAKLLLPSEKSAVARNRFWAAVRSAEAVSYWPASPDALAIRFEVASFWAAQPAIPENEPPFVEATALLGQSLAAGEFDRASTPLFDALELLRQAASLTPLPVGRAKLTLAFAQAMERQRHPAKLDPALITAAYESASLATRGTPDHVEALIRRAQWAVQNGFLSSSGGRNNDLSRGAVARKIPASEFSRLLTPLHDALAAASNAGSGLSPQLRQLVRGLDQRREQLTKPSVEIETLPAYLPDSRLSFGVVAQHVGEIDFELHRVTLDQLRAITVEKPIPAGTAALAGATPYQRWTLSTGLGSELGSTRTHHLRPENLPVGAYVLIARGNTTPSSTPAMRWFLVTKVQALAQSGLQRDVDIYAYEQETGKLLPNVRGQIWNTDGSEAFTPVEPGRGHGVLPASKTRYSPFTIFGEADGEPFSIPLFYAGAPAPDDQFLFHLIADRPLYQPGETAQWKLSLRQRLKGELRTPAGARLKITAKIRDEKLGSWEVTLNELGSASGKLVIPALAAPGQVAFEVRGDPDDGHPAHIVAFSVDNFRPPETVLSLAPLDADQIRRAQPGSEVTLKVSARYFSGEPVASTPVAIGAQFSRRWTPFDVPTDGPENYQVPDPVRLSVVTDARGDALVRLPLPVDLPRRAHLNIIAGLEGAGTTSATNLAFDILPGGYTAEIVPASQLAAKPAATPAFFYERDIPDTRSIYAAPGQPVELAVLTRDGRDAAVAVKGQLTISKKICEEIWRSPDGQLVTGDALRERQGATPYRSPRDSREGGAWELVRSNYRSENVGVFDIATDPSGRVAVQVPPLETGYYEVNYEPETPTADGLPLARVGLFVAAAGDQRLGYHTLEPMIIPCVDQQPPGKPIRALVILPVSARNAVIRITGADGSERRTEFFEGDTRIVEFPWKPSYASGARLDVSVLAADVRESAGAVLKISNDARRAIVTLKAESDRSRPGEKVRVQVHTNDAAGRPLSSEVALAVADAAVASLVPPGRLSLADNFLQPANISSPSVSRSARAEFTGSKTQGLSDGNGSTTEDMIVLTPFEVSTSGDRGYAAGNSLAGSRVAMNSQPAFSDVKVRSTFSYTAFWAPDVKTDRQGNATVELTYPDNLTAWQITAEAIASDNRFGSAQTSTQTSLPLQARLRAPRTLVVGDSATLLGAIVSQTSAPEKIRAELSSTESATVELTGPHLQAGTVPAEGETILDWTVRAKSPGKSTLRFTALGEKLNDAMELNLPVKEDGFYQAGGITGRAANHPLQLDLPLPTPLNPARTKVEFQISPGITPSLVQALPYLIDYPYGCVEQTVSRFLPAAVVAKLLRDLGFNAAEIEKQIMPSTLPAPAGRRSGAGLGKLDAVIEQSLARLQEAQSHGTFGWFPEGEADAYMTAYVLRGLNVAASADIALPGAMHRQTYESTLRLLAENNPDLTPQKLAWVLCAATGFPEKPDAKQSEVLQRTFAQLYTQRSALGPAGIALLAQSARALRRDQESVVLRRNLDNGASRATTAEFGKTVHWGKSSDYFEGLDGAVETTALCLQALLAFDPKDETADAAAAWLLLNRQSGRWNNTRDTALALLALSDYARARGETSARGGFRLTVNGRVLAEKRFDRASLLAATVFQAEASALQAGRNQIVLERTGGDSPCYLSVTTRSWAEAESTGPAGSFLKVSREFRRIVENDTVIGIPLSESRLLPVSDATVSHGERVECRLTFEVPHDLDYVILESPKPGGCEPLNALSGWDARLQRSETNHERHSAAPGDERPLYREEHDDRSVFFLPHVPSGRWEIRYTMRASFAGDFRALPATAAAIYVPVVAANTDSRRIAIKERSAP